MKVLKWAVLLACGLVLSACSVAERANYMYTPSLGQRALQDNIYMMGDTGKPKKAGIPLADADVYAFLQDMKDAWRYRMQVDRGIAVGGETGRAILGTGAAVAAGAGAGVPVVGGLAAGSSFLGRLLGIAQPIDRSNAYISGLAELNKAESAFVKALAKADDGEGSEISGTRLTIAGATLNSRINYAITMVDKALANTLPTMEELTAAQEEIPMPVKVPKVPKTPKVPDAAVTNPEPTLLKPPSPPIVVTPIP